MKKLFAFSMLVAIMAVMAEPGFAQECRSRSYRIYRTDRRYQTARRSRVYYDNARVYYDNPQTYYGYSNGYPQSYYGSSNGYPQSYYGYSNGYPQAYYGYSNGYRGRSFWDRHRNKLTVVGGTAGGAALGALIGGRRGAAIGALTGLGGSALYAYRLRNRRYRY